MSMSPREQALFQQSIEAAARKLLRNSVLATAYRIEDGALAYVVTVRFTGGASDLKDALMNGLSIDFPAASGFVLDVDVSDPEEGRIVASYPAQLFSEAL